MMATSLLLHCQIALLRIGRQYLCQSAVCFSMLFQEICEWKLEKQYHLMEHFYMDKIKKVIFLCLYCYIIFICWYAVELSTVNNAFMKNNFILVKKGLKISFHSIWLWKFAEASAATKKWSFWYCCGYDFVCIKHKS